MVSASDTAPFTTKVSALFFGTIAFATVALAVHSALCGNIHVIQTAHGSTRSSALDTTSFASVYTLLHHWTLFGMILLYAYLMEYHPPHPHADKSYDRDEFFFLTSLLLVVSAFTLKKSGPTTTTTTEEKITAGNNNNNNKNTRSNGNSPNSNNNSLLNGNRPVAKANEATEVLNRDQTEEWKGWMQFMFLLYHYYHAEEVYNAIRIMITCYVWMTGFGNFSFFYLKADYSSVRVLQMLWRLNFLVLFLCLTQGTTYILYYICLLHTYFFLMVYVTMRIAKHVNYSKWGIRIKLAILAISIFLIWDVDTGIFQLLHGAFLGDQPMVGATSGALWEWYFRSSLDHWSTFLGMLFALNFPVTSLFFRKLEAQPLLPHVLGKAAMGGVLLACSVVWVMGPFQLGKFAYNQTNSYFGIVPVLTYIYFRNLTPWLRSHNMELLHQIGKTTLETYLMQHHIWLTSNAKSLLTWIPGWPKMNFLVVTIIYFFTSRRLYQLTLFLRGMLLPNNRDACFRNMLGLFLAIGFCFGLAGLLDFLEMLSLFWVAIFSIGFGSLLFSIVLLRTGSSLEELSYHDERTGLDRRLITFGSGFFFVTCVSIVWTYMAHTGAGKIAPLPRSCEHSVLQGSWIPVDGCNENARGSSYRDYHVDSLGTCDAHSWGWEAQAPSSLCRFARRDTKTLRKTLRHRNVTFVGDSIVRHLYHAMCRQLGDPVAGAYNTSMGKWADFSREYGNTAVDFRWAPYVTNLTSVVETIMSEKTRPDVVILGGGAWDRLHMYTTQAERDTYDDAISTLADQLDRLDVNVPVAWVIPTTINTYALITDQKKENIREDQMEDIRTLYGLKGVYAASTFVLDGTSFTSDRVQESYDGVHYPLSVYDGGAQILANAFDWLLREREDEDPFHGPQPGSMDNPFLGLLMLCFVFVSLFCIDGFLGASYAAALFAPAVDPRRLYNESFSALHKRMGLKSSESTLSLQELVAVASRDKGKDSDSEMISNDADRDNGEDVEVRSLISRSSSNQGSS